MKFLLHVLPLLALALVAKSILVCPNGVHSNCYPQIFQPSNEWQVVREDQQIPAGLHVRLNLETGETEARLLQAENDEKTSDMVLLDSDEGSSEIQERKDLQPRPKASFKKSRVSETELLDYDSSVIEVLDYEHNKDAKSLEKAIDTLIELSHDIDFGVQLSSHPLFFSVLGKIAETSRDSAIVEKAYRIMGSLLRNNPEAVENFTQNNKSGLIPKLYSVLQSKGVSEVVQKRILGIIHALALDMTYAFQNFNVNDASLSEGLNSLISVFPSLKAPARDRLVLILEDLNLLENQGSEANKTFSEFLQRFLYQRQVGSEKQFQTVFRTLAELHEAENLTVGKDFLQWLSKEAEERKAGLKRRDGEHSKEDTEFDSYIASARHVVFGNPNAARKADEL